MHQLLDCQEKCLKSVPDPFKPVGSANISTYVQNFLLPHPYPATTLNTNTKGTMFDALNGRKLLMGDAIFVESLK